MPQALRSLAFVVVVAAAAGAGGGCARTHLFYDTRELRHQPLEPRTRGTLLKIVSERIAGRRVTWVDADGKQTNIDSNSITKLPVAELGAVWMATSTGDVGGEHDMRVHVAGRGSVPISVVISLDGDIRVISPRRGDDKLVEREPALSEEDIRVKFALAGKLPGQWHEAERRALTESLASLQKAELDVVRDISFDREQSSRDGDASRAALYVMNGCRAKIFLYSTGVRADRFRFVGDVAAPKSAVLHSLIHEIGHAVEQAPARRRFCAAEKAPVAKANELTGEGNGLIENSPVIKAYMEALAGQPAPTDYGNSSAHESFAESFALFHVDPEALKRARPGVHAWFAKGGHLQALSAAAAAR